MDAPLWINGQPRSSSTNETFNVHNPQSKKVVSVSASASSQDCKEAIEAAGKAFLTWEHTPVTDKRAIFLKAADLLLSDKYKHAAVRAIREETAVDDFWGNLNVAASVKACLEAAGLATQVKGENFPSSSVFGAQVIVQRRAHGAILAIAPWNAPLNLSFRAVAIPLICGNTIVLKSSECSPRSQAIVAEVLHEAGLPPGVLNYLSISRENSPKLTAELIAHPMIRHINFTGSDRVGKIIAAEAAKYLKPCVFELGGKAPAVVLNDANVNDAARAIAYGAMQNSGQICMSTERVIVQRDVSQALIAKLTEICGKLKAGDIVADPTIQLSCLFSESSAENVVTMLREAKDGGAEVLLGDLAHVGAVVQPHVLQGVQPGMRLWDRESFGPVIVIAVVDTVDEAVELANATDYSLVASLWTRDLQAGLGTAARIRSGCTSINGPTIHTEIVLSHAGLGGATGYGRFDIEHFTVKRMIIVHPPSQKYNLVG